MPIAAQRQFRIKVSGIDDLFAQKTGGGSSSDVSRVYDGGALVPEVLASPAQVGDVTVTRPFRPERDQEVIAKFRPLVGRWRTTVSVQPTDADLVPVGNPETYTDALLIGIGPPEGDAGAGDPATLSLTFAVSSVA